MDREQDGGGSGGYRNDLQLPEAGKLYGMISFLSPPGAVSRWQVLVILRGENILDQGTLYDEA